MNTNKWYEDLGHVAIGLIPGVGLIREFRQLPPETDSEPVVMMSPERRRKGGEYWPASRVRDMMTDMIGYAVGDGIRTVVLVSLLIWRW